MKIFKEAFLLMLVGLGVGACSEDNPWAGSKGQGGINLHLSTSSDVKDAIPVVRSGAPDLVVPYESDFKIELRNLDTDMTTRWQSLDEFHSESGFDVGSYTLTAFYGAENECGFDKPYFKGEATVNVLEGRESSVEVTAQLANVMLSVEYTDNFKNYFRDYSVTAHTDGHANVTFNKTETRAGFLPAGYVTLQLSMTNPSGKTATITPAQFPAQARHHYHVKFDVNADPFGQAVLKVEFDDSVETENVDFNLSDELFNAEAPKVTASGFTSGQTFESLSGSAAPSPLKFEVECKGGIKSAVLKIAQVSGDTQYDPIFGKELDLVQADESVQNLLEKSGIKVAGIFKNPQQYAVVDVTNLSKSLPSGSYEITLTVTDNLGRNNEDPVTLALSTAPISLSVTGGSAVYVSVPGSTSSTTPTVDATVIVSYNGMNPESSIRFQNLCQHGIYKDCEIIKCEESTRTRGFVDKTYIFSIKVCDVENSPLPMKLFFNDKEYAPFNLEIIEPTYSLQGDAFSNYARFKVSTTNAEDLATVTNGLTLYDNGKAIDKSDESKFKVYPEKGMIYLYGLTPNKDYTIGYSLTTRPNGLPESNTLKIHTEAQIQITNGDFESIHQTINQKDVEVGGKYSHTVSYQAKANIVRSEPTGWASINAKTCWFGCPGAKNTWFQVPSTYSEGGKVIIRNVAYDHNGVKPAAMPTGFRVEHWYNTNVPTFTTFAAGELFLGSYSYNGSESLVDGIPFQVRPSSVSFEYSYVPEGLDKGIAEVSVLDESGQVIASNYLLLEGAISTKQANVNLIYDDLVDFGKKASKIRIRFKSSNSTSTDVSKYVHIPQGKELDEGFNAGNFGNINLGNNNYHAVATGSVLTIDNVVLNY